MRGTTTKTFCFIGSCSALSGFVDSDLARDIDTRRSTIGYIFIIGGIVVNWISRLQKVNALSTPKVEYVAATEASKEMIWLQFFLEELGQKEEDFSLYSDSQSVTHLKNISAFHSRIKHIQLRDHFIMYVLENGQLRLENIPISDNPIDMFMKAVPKEKLVSCSTSIGLLD